MPVDRILTFRRERLAVAVLIGAVAVHLLSLWICGAIESAGGLVFAEEARVLILVSLAGSALVFLFVSHVPFRVTLYARIIIDMIIIRIVGPEGLAIKVLLLNTVIVETVLYDRVAPGVVTSAIVTTAVVINEIMVRSGEGIEAQAINGALILVSALAMGAGYTFVSHLREKAVVDERSIRDLNNAFDKLTNSNLGLQSYAATVQTESAREERERITRELHDSIGYALTNIAMLMNASKVLLKDHSAPRLASLIEHSRETANKCLQETRATLYRLRSINEHTPVGLHALAHLAKVYSEATGTRVEVEYGNAAHTYGYEIDRTVYRFVQEGVTNAFRHNKAARITIRVSLYEQEGSLHVRIWDNGRGAMEITEGIGLKGMRERLSAVRGIMHYGNVVDGFVVSAAISMSGGERDETDSRPDRR